MRPPWVSKFDDLTLNQQEDRDRWEAEQVATTAPLAWEELVSR